MLDKPKGQLESPFTHSTDYQTDTPYEEMRYRMAFFLQSFYLPYRKSNTPWWNIYIIIGRRTNAKTKK